MPLPERSCMSWCYLRACQRQQGCLLYPAQVPGVDLGVLAQLVAVLGVVMVAMMVAVDLRPLPGWRAGQNRATQSKNRRQCE